MIDRNIFLSAHHYFPNNGESVTFYETNDSSGPSVTAQVLDSQRVGSSDIQIGSLTAPLPASYSYYDRADQNLSSFSDFTSSPYAGANAYLFGRSPNPVQIPAKRLLQPIQHGTLTSSGPTPGGTNITHVGPHLVCVPQPIPKWANNAFFSPSSTAR